MTETSLQTLLGLAPLPSDLRIAVELVATLICAAGAIALRHRRFALRSTGLVLMALGLVIDGLAHMLLNPHSKTALWADAISLVLFFFGALRVVLEAVDWAIHRGKSHFSTILHDLLLVVLYAAVVMVVLRVTLQFDLAPLLATSAVISVVLGFGLQETLGNIFSGLTLQVQHAYEPGHWVRFGNYVGRVQGIGWRSTRVVTRCNEWVEIPNSMISKDVLVNFSHGRQVADEMTIGLAYGEPPNRVKEVILRVLANTAEVLSNPAPAVMLVDYGDFAVQYKIRFWLADYTVQDEVRDAIYSSLWYSLRRHAIEIPFPISTVNLHQVRPEDELAAERDQRIMAELRQVDFLGALSDDDLWVLLPKFRIHQFGEGEILMRQGEVGESFHILRRGTVEVLAESQNGDGPIHITDLKAPAFFGEIALLTGEPRTATIKAKSDVEVLEINREGFSQLFRARPEAAEAMGEVLTTRLNETRQRVSASSGPRRGAANDNWLLAKMRRIFDL